MEDKNNSEIINRNHPAFNNKNAEPFTILSRKD